MCWTESFHRVTATSQPRIRGTARRHACACSFPIRPTGDVYFLSKSSDSRRGPRACECERSGEVSMAQTLALLNSNEIHDKVAGDTAKHLAAVDAGGPNEQKVTDLYYAAFSRPPVAHELQTALAMSEKYKRRRGRDKPSPEQIAADRRSAYEDLLWGLINTKEFLFNH